MTREQRERYKSALVETISRLRRPLFHVTAMLAPNSTCPALEDALVGWAARVDRFYLGRSWHKSECRMAGLAFFELYPDIHGHLVVAPPSKASALHFLLNAQFWFAPDRVVELRGSRPRPIATKGKMMIQQVADTDLDLARVVAYSAKEIEYRNGAMTDWKFIRDLSRH